MSYIEEGGGFCGSFWLILIIWLEIYFTKLFQLNSKFTCCLPDHSSHVIVLNTCFSTLALISRTCVFIRAF